jgi:thiamine biosynthesis lipoprotein
VIRPRYSQSVPVMGTIVTIDVYGPRDDAHQNDYEEYVGRAFEWFHRIEYSFSRFDPESELMQLCAKPAGTEVPVSQLLFEAVQYAITLADVTRGCFDPTIGRTMEQLGYNREYRTGAVIDSANIPLDEVSYRDVRLNPQRTAITLVKPLILDLGALAKGLAMDLAARTLRPFQDFVINAGGDIYFGGCNPEGEEWSAGIRHPRHENAIIGTVKVTDKAVCTSGDYERGRHIIDPHTHQAVTNVASATVVSITGMSADAFATAAFVLGPERGIKFLNDMCEDGVIITSTLERYETEAIVIV